VARLLAQRALANEDLARQRGADLANQLRLNRQIIQDMQDGVLVVGRGPWCVSSIPRPWPCWERRCARA
jgi:hypothetical protein